MLVCHNLRRRLAAAVYLIIGLCLPASLHAATYYVSPYGDDANPGTSEELPWKTVARVNEAVFAPGDSILFQGRQNFAGNLYFDSADRGELSLPVTVGSYGTGIANIKAGAGYGVLLYNTAGFVFRDLSLTGNWDPARPTVAGGIGIWALNDLPGAVKLAGLRFENLRIQRFRTGGVYIGASPADRSASGFTDVHFTRCQVSDNGDVGIGTYGASGTASGAYSHERVSIAYCTTQRNRGIPNKGSNSGSGILLGEVADGLIERCVASDNGDLNNHAAGGPVGIWAYNSTRLVIQHSESYRNKSKTHDGGGFDLDGGVTDSVIQYCYSHDNAGAGFLLAQYEGAAEFARNVIRYCISQNDGMHRGDAALFFWDGHDGIRDCAVYNNVFYVSTASGRPRGPAIRFMKTSATPAMTNVAVYNNVIATTSSLYLAELQAGGELQFRGNVYWTYGGDFLINWRGQTIRDMAAWRQTALQETWNDVPVGVFADPLFTGPGLAPTLRSIDYLETLTAYTVPAYSPVANTGIPVPELLTIPAVTRDLAGVSAPIGTPDAGAYETRNYLRNTGFEAGYTDDWLQWWDPKLADNAAWINGSAPVHSGSNRLIHRVDGTISPSGRYEQLTYQYLEDLPDGTYTLRVRLAASGDRSWLGVDEYDPADRKASRALQTASDPNYREYVITGIPVTGGHCRVFLWSSAHIGDYVIADDFELVRTAP